MIDFLPPWLQLVVVLVAMLASCRFYLVGFLEPRP
jgi:hypothetical protein